MSPLVSIVIALEGTEGKFYDAVRSCRPQSLVKFELICVTRSSISATVTRVAEQDPLVRIVRVPPDIPMPEARRAGALAARAPYLLFVDDDTYVRDETLETLYRKAVDANADLLYFGVDRSAGHVRGAAAIPPQLKLTNEEILRRLFLEETTDDVRIPLYLIRTGLLRTVYESLTDASAARVPDDAAVMFLACAASHTFVSATPTPYQRPPRGSTGAQTVPAEARYRLAIDAIDSIDVIEPVVRRWAREIPNPEPLVDGYESMRERRIATALEMLGSLPEEARQSGIRLLRAHVDEIDIIAAGVTLVPTWLRAMAQEGERIELGRAHVRSVLLTTNRLTTGGVSAVLAAQARMLLDAGYRVTIATHRNDDDESAVPDGATLLQIFGSTRQRLHQWVAICRDYEIDVVIDHRILYSRDWPGYALAARALQIPTIGWIHNFAGRPTYNGNDLHSFMRSHLSALAQLIVLSPLDVAFWKLRNVTHVAYLPNPPSPLLLDSVGRMSPKSAPRARRLELVWWGRLEEHTKKLSELVEVATALRHRGAHFRLRIIGPDWTDMSARALSALVSERHLEEFVEVTGPRRGPDLLDAIDSSDMFVNTSIIEGYPLTLAEAQSRGLPILMYDLPWLSIVQENLGVIAVPQGDADALAEAIIALASDAHRFEALSRASLEAAARTTRFDFATLYQELLSGSLPVEFSPEPTMEAGRKILDLLIFFAENRPRRKKPSSRAKRQPAPARRIGFAARLERKLTPVGHRVVDLAPWLLPVIRRVKHALLRL